MEAQLAEGEDLTLLSTPSISRFPYESLAI